MKNPTVITADQERTLVNDIAISLGIEQPFIPWVERGDVIIEWVRDNRKWRNWLEAVEGVANEHGPIRLAECEGQGTFDI